MTQATQANDEVEILLVEDNPDDAELTILALKRFNLANRLLWVKDGAEALDFLYGSGGYSGRDITRQPRLVLLDLFLPQVSGIEVLRRIKGDERTHRIPVVVLTASKKDADAKECYRLGVNSYIAKPLAFDEVVKVVSELGLYWLQLNKSPHG